MLALWVLGGGAGAGVSGVVARPAGAGPAAGRPERPQRPLSATDVHAPGGRRGRRRGSLSCDDVLGPLHDRRRRQSGHVTGPVCPSVCLSARTGRRAGCLSLSGRRSTGTQLCANQPHVARLCSNRRWSNDPSLLLSGAVSFTLPTGARPRRRYICSGRCVACLVCRLSLGPT